MVSTVAMAMLHESCHCKLNLSQENRQDFSDVMSLRTWNLVFHGQELELQQVRWRLSTGGFALKATVIGDPVSDICNEQHLQQIQLKFNVFFSLLQRFIS